MIPNEPIPGPGRFRRLRAVAGVAAVLFGLLLIVAVAALGHCSAFGGRCPREAPSLLDDDVFGMAAAGGFIAVAVPTWLAQPSLRRARLAVPIGILAGLVIGLLARSAAAG